MDPDENSPTVEVTVNELNSNPIDEVVEEIVEEIAEPTASEIVEVAQIEADRDIALAAINAEVEEQRIEAAKEVNEEYAECQRELEALRTRVEELAQLIQPPQLVEVITEPSEIVPEPNLIQPSTAAPTVETLTELSEESAEESPVGEIPNRGRRFIAI